MTESETTGRTGRQLLKALQTSVARFYPCDFHVHSPGSFDVCQSSHFDHLPNELRTKILETAQAAGFSLPLGKSPTDPAAYDEAMATPELVQAFLDQVVSRRDMVAQDESVLESDNWCIVAITDHNTTHFACALAKEAWTARKTRRVIVCPGIELDVSFDVPGLPTKCRVHVLCLFAPLTQSSDIRIAISEARPQGTPSWNMGQPIEVSDLGEFVHALRNHASYPAICIAAHVGSNKGIQKEPVKMRFAHLDAEIARLEGELSRAADEGSTMDASEIQARLEIVEREREDGDAIHLDVLRIIGRCGFDALQVGNQSHETHYRRLHRFRENQGRGVPIVCSDAHTPDQIFRCPSGIPFAKISASILSTGSSEDIFSEIRDRVLRFGETRTTYASPGAVTHWIDAIEISRDAQDASGFWNQTGSHKTQSDSFTLELSRNLNCFVGGRGSGKSAGIEALAFLTDPGGFIAEGKKREADDWYLRARATLAGCPVRVVWKSTADDGIGRLPKKALLVSSYFDPGGDHQSVDTRDADDNAIVDSSLSLPRVRILRVHEIEETARPDNLRRLFDDLCGPRIDELTANIETLRAQIMGQREQIIDVVTTLAELTSDGSPLRQYAIRKQQFDNVNKPELQSRFQEADKSAEATKIAKKTVAAWEQLDVEATLDDLAGQTEEFFDSAFSGIPQADGQTEEHHAPLATLLNPEPTESEPAETSKKSETERKRLLSALEAASSSAKNFAARLLGTVLCPSETYRENGRTCKRRNPCRFQ